jgi:hypothetical protein
VFANGWKAKTMRRARRLIAETSNTTLGIILAFALIILIIVLPRLIPGGRFGASCSALAHPIPGGNNQSLLSARSAGALRLEIDVQHSNLAVGESLVVNATFINEGVGGIILFFVPQEALLRDDGTPGLSFVIQRLADGATLSEPTTVRPPNPQRTTFPTEVLHILGPRQRCTEQLTFDTIRLNSLGLAPGRYFIRAAYRNPFRGTLNVSPAATATPIFPDQGVYVTQELLSNEVEFTVGLQQPTPLVATGEAPPLGG